MDIVIFGTGRTKDKILGFLRPEAKIIGYLDNNTSLKGTRVDGCLIFAPEDVCALKFDYVLIAVRGEDSVKTQLLGLGVSVEKILCPLSGEYENLSAMRNVVYMDSIYYAKVHDDIEELKTIIRNYPYELVDKITHGKIVFPKIESSAAAIELITQNHLSLSRFGDGEFDLLLGRGNSFQDNDENLRKRLQEVLVTKSENILIGIPDAYGAFENRTDEFIQCFRTHLANGGRQREYHMLDMNKQYYDAFLTRPYKDYIDKAPSAERFEAIKTLWKDRDITIVEGMQTRLGMGNDLFAGTRSCQRILCPVKNAFSFYDEILEAVKCTEQDRLVLIALGATATVLAYDLSEAGYQALDIGHIDIEYEWFVRNLSKMTSIPGKYVNEVPGGNVVDDDWITEEYTNQIVKVIEEGL